MCISLTSTGRKCKNKNIQNSNKCFVHTRKGENARKSKSLQKGGLITKQICYDRTYMETKNLKDPKYAKVIEFIKKLIDDTPEVEKISITIKLLKNINKINLLEVPDLLIKDMYDVLNFISHKVDFSEKQLQLIEEGMEKLKYERLDVIMKEINTRASNTFEILSRKKNYEHHNIKVPPEIVEMIGKYTKN